MQEEIWKDVRGYEGLYMVSSIGRVKSLRTNSGKIFKPYLRDDVYPSICLWKDAEQKTKKIHQLVAEAFLNHVPCGYEYVVNHINHNKHDNRVENLEVVTNRENSNRKHIKSTSQYTGVHWCKISRTWKAQITIGKKKVHLGQFKEEIEASNIYEKAVKNINLYNGNSKDFCKKLNHVTPVKD